MGVIVTVERLTKKKKRVYATLPYAQLVLDWVHPVLNELANLDLVGERDLIHLEIKWNELWVSTTWLPNHGFTLDRIEYEIEMLLRQLAWMIAKRVVGIDTAVVTGLVNEFEEGES